MPIPEPVHGMSLQARPRQTPTETSKRATSSVSARKQRPSGIRANARRVKWLTSPSAYAQIIQQHAEMTEDDDPYDDLYETDETEEKIDEIEEDLETT